MNEIQTQAAFHLAVSPAVQKAHQMISEIRSNEPWEFATNYSGWTISHVNAITEYTDWQKIVQGCIENMGVELKDTFTTNMTNNL